MNRTSARTSRKRGSLPPHSWLAPSDGWPRSAHLAASPGLPHQSSLSTCVVQTPSFIVSTAKRADNNPPDGWTIEALTDRRDIDAVLAIEQASFTSPWTKEMYLAEFENHGISFFYLAKSRSGDIVGFCSFWRVLDELHINNLLVLPQHRRTGVATALLSRVLGD